MQSNFVRDVPTIEIEDGLVHVTTAQGDWWWKPSTFRRYVELGRRQLAAFDYEARTVIPFRPDDDD